MVMKPIHSEKVYSVHCDACSIEETMIFSGGIFSGPMLPILWGSASVPFGYRFVETTSTDAEGNEVERVFKPVRGAFGDSLPKTCPKCGGSLAVQQVRLTR